MNQLQQIYFFVTERRRLRPNHDCGDIPRFLVSGHSCSRYIHSELIQCALRYISCQHVFNFFDYVLFRFPGETKVRSEENRLNSEWQWISRGEIWRQGCFKTRASGKGPGRKPDPFPKPRTYFEIVLRRTKIETPMGSLPYTDFKEEGTP